MRDEQARELLQRGGTVGFDVAHGAEQLFHTAVVLQDEFDDLSGRHSDSPSSNNNEARLPRYPRSLR
ncbi:hypothetical protein [Streptomyces swartbergensis]|uniref:hypothetical protein n=1 Tax=Streptomyces swartbergensis TaxID=487165 RepID=UPI003804D1B8